MQTEQLFCLSNKSGLAPSWPTALWSLVKKKIQTWDAVHVCCGFLRWSSILHQSQHRQLCQVYLWLVSDGNLENLPSSEHSGYSSALTLNMKTQNGTAVMPGAFVKASWWPARELQLQLHRKMVLSKVHAEGLWQVETKAIMWQEEDEKVCCFLVWITLWKSCDLQLHGHTERDSTVKKNSTLKHSMIWCLGQCEPTGCSYTEWFERLREKLHMNRADSTRKQEAWNMVDTSAGEEFQWIPDWETCFTLICSAYEGSY